MVYIWMRIKLFLKIKIFILYVHVPEWRLEGERFFGQVTTLRFLSSITLCKFHCIYLKQSPFKYNFDQRNCSPPQVFFFKFFFGGDWGWVVLFNNYMHMWPLSMLHVRSTHFTQVHKHGLSINKPVNTAILTCQLGHMMTPNRVSEFFSRLLCWGPRVLMQFVECGIEAEL